MLQNVAMDHSDDDHSFELVDSDDLRTVYLGNLFLFVLLLPYLTDIHGDYMMHFRMMLYQEKTDQTDDESFELLGSEELNSALKDIVEVATADKLTENELEYSDPDSSGTPNTVCSIYMGTLLCQNSK